MKKLVMSVLLQFLLVAIWNSHSWGGAQGGPVVLMGIDAEDGGVGGHGPITVYQDVVNSILGQVSNGGAGILVIGGDKDPADDVTEFWDAIEPATQPVTFVNGTANIAAQSFAGFAMIAVASDEDETSDGGLTQAENDAMATRQGDVANFVNGGGGLLGFSSNFFAGAGPYAYLAGVGAFTVNIGLSYEEITPTAEGLAIGITDALDVCCWHNEYIVFPSFLKVLASNDETENPSAIGGAEVVIPEQCQCPTDSPKGCIAGTVVDANTGVPVAGKHVIIRRAFPKLPKNLKSWKQAKWCRRSTRRATTDSNGCYTFQDLRAGRYDIFVTGRGKAIGGKGRHHFPVVIRRGHKVNNVRFEKK